jgi:hypothetical protein
VALPSSDLSDKPTENRLSFRQPIGIEDQQNILLPAGWKVDGGPERWKGGTITHEVMELYRQWGSGTGGGNAVT